MPQVKRKRYTAAEKQEILDFVKEYNKSNGRGGQSAAAEKYKVSTLSISNWLKGKKAPSKKASKTKVAKTKVAQHKTQAVETSSAKGSVASVLKRMTAIQEQITALGAEFEALKKQL